MDTQLLEVLACARCRGELVLKAGAGAGDSVQSGSLTCVQCGEVYRIADGVPCMIPGTSDWDTTRRAFSDQWRLRSEGQFEREGFVFGEDTVGQITGFFQNQFKACSPGEWLLDAGCGTGEKTFVAARLRPEVRVVGMDFSDSVWELARRGKRLPNFHPVQGDVCRPPFRDGAFQKLICAGVLHHTPDTRQAFATMSRLVAPGGWLGTWIYPHPSESELWRSYYLIRDRVFLGQGHALPPAARLALVKGFCALTFPAFLLMLRGDRKHSGPHLTLADKFKQFVFVTFDNISPEHQLRHRQEEVLGWYEAWGFTEVETDRDGLYFGKKLAPPSTSPEI